jgi:hypothetical protein
MSATRRLRFGPLPKTETVEVTVSCTVTVVLKAELERYAEMHSQPYGEPVDAATPIPHMLETFMGVTAGSSMPTLRNHAARMSGC